MMKDESRELKPADTNGSGIPVFGISSIETPILIKLWSPIAAPLPAAISLPAISLVRAAIRKHSKRWSISRIPKTDLAVLRLAVCEILFMKDIPDSVAINEAVELARAYGEENSPSYVNGILGAIAREKTDE